MFKKLFIFCISLFILTSCGENVPALVNTTTTYEFPYGDSSVFKVEISDSLFPTVVTDNYYYTDFQNGVNVTLYSNSVKVGYKYNSDYDLWTSPTAIIKEVDNGQLIFKFPEEYYDNILLVILKGKVVEQVDYDMYDEWKLEEMPGYSAIDDMVMLDDTLFTLESSEINPFGGHVAVKWDGSDFLEVFTQDGLLETLAPSWLQRLSINGDGSTPKWYLSSRIFYAECGRYCMAAKQLTGNQWYVYFGTKVYRDHMLYGCSKIKYVE